jgi:hypothetical protein
LTALAVAGDTLGLDRVAQHRVQDRTGERLRSPALPCVGNVESLVKGLDVLGQLDRRDFAKHGPRVLDDLLAVTV